jgi:hypothetical protein
VIDETINLPTESQFSLLSEEGEVLEEELIPVHGDNQLRWDTVNSVEYQSRLFEV